MHWYGGIFGMYLPMAILVAVAYYLGSGVMENILDAIPQFVQDGLTISAGILPALGFAILLRMILNKKIAAFFSYWICNDSIFKPSGIGSSNHG